MTLKAFERKARFLFWVSRGFVLRHFLKFILIVGVGLAVFFLFNKTAGFKKLTTPSHQEAIIGRYHPDKLPDRVLVSLSQGLTKIDQQGRVQGDLAKSWEVKDGGKVFVFHLGDNLTWNDGTPIVSSDLNIAFDNIKITYPDKNSIQFELTDPFAPFPGLLSKPVFNKKTNLGTGIYKLNKTRIAKDGYLETLDLVATRSGLPNIKFKFYPNKDQAILALKMGEVDGIADCQCAGDFANWPNIASFKSTDFGKFVAVFFNTQDILLSNKEIRQSLAFATKKDNLPGSRAVGPIPQNSIYFNPNLKSYDYNLEKAKELIKDLPKEQRVVTLKTLPSFENLAKSIASDWQQLDFTVKVEVSENLDNNFQALVAGQQFSPDPDQYTLWHSTQEKTNITKIKHPKIDKLLEDGRKTVDEEKRKEIYFDLQKTLVDETPAIFLYHPDSIYVTKKKTEDNLKKINGVLQNFWPFESKQS